MRTCQLSNISQAQNDKYGDPTPARPPGVTRATEPKAGSGAAGAEMGLAASWVESLGVLRWKGLEVGLCKRAAVNGGCR